MMYIRTTRVTKRLISILCLLPLDKLAHGGSLLRRPPTAGDHCETVHIDLVVVETETRALLRRVRDSLLRQGLDVARRATIRTKSCYMAKLLALKARLFVHGWFGAVSGGVVAMAVAALGRFLGFAAGSSV